MGDPAPPRASQRGTHNASVDWNVAPLAAAANWRPGAKVDFFGCQLRPSRTGLDVIDTDVATGEQLKRLGDLFALVELCSLLAKRFEPRRKDEVRHQYVIDPVAEFFRFAGITDLSRNTS